MPRLKNINSHGLTQMDLKPGTLILLLTDRYHEMIYDDRKKFGQ